MRAVKKCMVVPDHMEVAMRISANLGDFLPSKGLIFLFFRFFEKNCETVVRVFFFFVEKKKCIREQRKTEISKFHIN